MHTIRALLAAVLVLLLLGCGGGSEWQPLTPDVPQGVKVYNAVNKELLGTVEDPKDTVEGDPAIKVKVHDGSVQHFRHSALAEQNLWVVRSDDPNLP